MWGVSWGEGEENLAGVERGRGGVGDQEEEEEGRRMAGKQPESPVSLSAPEVWVEVWLEPWPEVLLDKLAEVCLEILSEVCMRLEVLSEVCLELEVLSEVCLWV